MTETLVFLFKCHQGLFKKGSTKLDRFRSNQSSFYWPKYQGGGRNLYILEVQELQIRKSFYTKLDLKRCIKINTVINQVRGQKWPCISWYTLGRLGGQWGNPVFIFEDHSSPAVETTLPRLQVAKLGLWNLSSTTHLKAVSSLPTRILSK